MSQELLDLVDVQQLTELLLLSKQIKVREALCIQIGVNYDQLPFLRENSDSAFVILLIDFLNRTGDQEALCKICCQVILPILPKGRHRSTLIDIAEKISCNVESRRSVLNNIKVENLPLSPSFPKVFSIIITITATIVTGSLTIFFTVLKNRQPIKFSEKCHDINIQIPDNRSYTKLQAICNKLNEDSHLTSIHLRGIENRNGQLVQTPNEEDSNFQQSCTQIKIEGSILSADCRKLDQTIAHSSIELKDIVNDDGNFKYLN